MSAAERARWGIAVGLVLAGAFLLRIWGIKQGLPYAYNADENAHFVPKAIALFDVPTLAPICLSLWGTAGILRGGRLGHYAIAGLGLGLACATKYTGGIVLLPLLAASAVHGRRAVPGLALAAVVSIAAFFVAN